MKLLRLLEEKEIVPLGSTRSIKVDVRLIAATNKDLMEEVQEARFREDLYYRLNVIPIVLPPLRQRKDDIPVLAQYFLKTICGHENIGERKFLQTTIKQLQDYHWPGNVRELGNAMRRAVALCDGGVIRNADLPEHFVHYKTQSAHSVIDSDTDKTLTLAEIEKRHIIKVLESV